MHGKLPQPLATSTTGTGAAPRPTHDSTEQQLRAYMRELRTRSYGHAPAVLAARQGRS
ncbi:hypothetical protein [Bordetella sp. 2513F-2]